MYICFSWALVLLGSYLRLAIFVTTSSQWSFWQMLGPYSSPYSWDQAAFRCLLHFSLHVWFFSLCSGRGALKGLETENDWQWKDPAQDIDWQVVVPKMSTMFHLANKKTRGCSQLGTLTTVRNSTRHTCAASCFISSRRELGWLEDSSCRWWGQDREAWEQQWLGEQFFPELGLSHIDHIVSSASAFVRTKALSLWRCQARSLHFWRVPIEQTDWAEAQWEQTSMHEAKNSSNSR